MKNENTEKIISIVLNVIPIAMSIATIVLMTLKQINADTGIIMLAIGMFSGALEKTRNNKNEK